MHSMNWDDLRIVLAVASQGSASAAARALGVNHATVVRRIKAFEESQGIRVFDHLATGYRLTPNGQHFVEAAQSIDTTILQLQRKVIGEQEQLEGRVRLTTTDGLFPLVTDDLQRLRKLFPGITLDLLITNQHISLDDLQADLAIRTSQDPPAGLVSELVGKVDFAVYGNEPERELASDKADTNVQWIGFNPPISMSPPGKWLEEQVPPELFVMRCSSFLHARSLIELGVGMGVLPCFLGDTVTNLHRVWG